MTLEGQPANLVFVLIFRLKNRRYYPLYYRSQPIDGKGRDLWRFVPGLLDNDGYVDVKDAQAKALLLGRQLNAVQHGLAGALFCPPEHILLDTVIDVVFMPAFIEIPPFGPGRRSLREWLEVGAQRVERKDKRLIIVPGEA
jgi:hypothetical protein